MDRVKYVARWVAMVPCALAAVLLAPHIVGVLFDSPAGIAPAGGGACSLHSHAPWLSPGPAQGLR